MATIVTSCLCGQGWGYYPQSLNQIELKSSTEGDGKDLPGKEAPWAHSAWSLHVDHSPQITLGPSTAKPSIVHSKDDGPSGCQDFEESPGLHVPWCWGSHLQSPSLQSPHVQRTAHSTQHFCRGLDFFHIEGQGVEVMRPALGLCSGTFCPPLQPKSRTVPNHPLTLVTKGGEDGLLSPCGYFINYNLKSVLWGITLIRLLGSLKKRGGNLKNCHT